MSWIFCLSLSLPGTIFLFWQLLSVTCSGMMKVSSPQWKTCHKFRWNFCLLTRLGRHLYWKQDSHRTHSHQWLSENLWNTTAGISTERNIPLLKVSMNLDCDGYPKKISFSIPQIIYMFDLNVLQELSYASLLFFFLNIIVQTGHDLGGNFNIHISACSGYFIVRNRWTGNNGTIQNAYKRNPEIRKWNVV